MQDLTLWSKMHFSRVLVLAQSAFRVLLSFDTALGGASAQVKAHHRACQPNGLMRGTTPQAKFSLSLFTAPGHLLRVTKKSTDRHHLSSCCRLS